MSWRPAETATHIAKFGVTEVIHSWQILQVIKKKEEHKYTKLRL